MKIRKHKNNKTFRISFTAAWTPVRQCVLAIGSDAPSVLRAFLFGRDASNLSATIHPV